MSYSLMTAANILYLLMIAGLLAVLLCAHVFDRASRESGIEEPEEEDSDEDSWIISGYNCPGDRHGLYSIGWADPVERILILEDRPVHYED